MKVGPNLQAVGQQCGVNVEALYQKYQASAPKHNTSAAITRDKSTTDTARLNCFRIYNVCHGYGLMKQMYNHQVKEVNCGECEGEGIIVNAK